MAHEYHFPTPSLLSRLVIGKNPSDRMEATLYAAPCEDTQLLQQLPQRLARQGLSCYADEAEGKPVLKIAGLNAHHPEAVLSILRQSGVVHAPAGAAQTKEETPQLKERFRKNTVRLSGIFGDLGHLAMIGSGLIVKDYNRVATASTYFTATTLLAAYGNGAGGIPFARMMHDLRGYFAKEGIALPDAPAHTPEAVLQHRSAGRRFVDGIKSHPLEISNTLGLLGNLSLLRSGLQEMKFNSARVGAGRAVSGGIGAVGTITGMLVPEASEEEKKAMRKRKSLASMVADGQVGQAVKEAPQRLVDLVRRSPLAILGGLNLINNVGLLHSAIEERQNFKNALNGGTRTKWKFGFIKDGVEPVLSHEARIQNLTPQIEALQKSTLVGEAGAKNLFKLNALRSQQMHLTHELEGIKRVKWGWVLAVATAVLYPVASVLMAFSSKKRDKSLESKQAYGEMYAYAANIVLGLPPEKQQKIIDKMGGYLSSQPEVKISAEEIRAGISAKLAVIDTGPWGLTSKTPATEVAASPPENAGPSWRARLDAAKEQAAAHGASHSVA